MKAEMENNQKALLGEIGRLATLIDGVKRQEPQSPVDQAAL